MLQIENTEYAIGTIWGFLNESETETIKSFYDVLIQYKDNKDLVVYLYSSMNPHPKHIDSGYYDEETFRKVFDTNLTESGHGSNNGWSTRCKYYIKLINNHCS